MDRAPHGPCFLASQCTRINQQKSYVIRSELEILITGMITFSHSIRKKIKHQFQSFTRIGRQFQSLERQVYADWT